jgi:phosphatidate cytidylyltransferase
VLGQRVLTAAVLIAILAGVLLSGSFWLFVALVTITLLAAAWEMERMRAQGWKQSVALFIALFVLLTFGAAYYLGRTIFHPNFGDSWLLIATLFWGVVIVRVWVQDPSSGEPIWMLGPFVGAVMLFGAWLGAITLFKLNIQLLLAVIAVPIIADTAAYFVGRRFGKRKLAPKISPGKTVEGAIGGFVGVLVCMGAWVVHIGWPLWTIIVFCVLSAFSVVGDLYESLLKRRFGVKDSSNLLPGHGGVLDRIDAQLPVLAIGALLFSWFSIS